MRAWPAHTQAVGSFSRRRAPFARSVATFLLELPTTHFRFEERGVTVERLKQSFDWVFHTTLRRLWPKSATRITEIWRMHMEQRARTAPALTATVAAPVATRSSEGHCTGSSVCEFRQLMSRVKHQSGPMPALPATVEPQVADRCVDFEYSSLTDFVGRDLLPAEVEQLDVLLHSEAVILPVKVEEIERPVTPEAEARASSALTRAAQTRQTLSPEELLAMLISQGSDPEFIGKVMKTFQ